MTCEIGADNRDSNWSAEGGPRSSNKAAWSLYLWACHLIPASGAICLLGQLRHIGKKCRRLANEKPHVCQKRESSHCRALRPGWPNDRNNRKASIQERTGFGHDQVVLKEFTDTPVTGSTAVKAGAFPALSDQV